jgi:acyl-CoA synthetase (NDP forming)
MWLRNMSTFQGPVYSVNIDAREIPGIEALGVPNYARLIDIPEPVDFVVVAVPRRAAPLVLQDAIAKEVAGVAMFTAGFAETGEAEGLQLQQTITTLARQAHIASLAPIVWGCTIPGSAFVIISSNQPARRGMSALSRKAVRTPLTSASTVPVRG